MREHTYEVHTDCNNPYCPICDGGLSVCTVCRCVEGSLATECPGYDCYMEHGDKIYKGVEDFINGQWVAK